ncbi:MAG: response regulator, partial [bacterium]
WDNYVSLIMLTTLTGKKNYLEGMDAGADDFLNKPVDMEELTVRLRVADRMHALRTEVKQLEGLLTICAYCKNIRDENNTWQQIEGYIAKRSEAEFSHGYCPECYEKHIVPQLLQCEADRLARETKIVLT